MGGLLQNISLIGDEIPWLKTLRQKGRQAFASAGIPGAKTEAWKYLKPRELDAADYVLSVPETSASAANLPFECYRICFANGRFSPAFSNLPAEIEVVPLVETFMDKEGQAPFYADHVDWLEQYPFAALNMAYLNEGVFVRIPEDCHLDKPVVIDSHTACGEANLFSNLHNIIILEKGAKAEILEYYHYSGEIKSRYFNNIVNQIFIAENANLRHIKVQKEAFKAAHIAVSPVSVNAGGRYESFCLQLGADIARNETKVMLKQAGAECEVNAAYRIDGWAKIDTTTDIEHQAPCTISHQLVKGVAGGHAKGIFQGKIHIAKDCVQTEGNQLHKALLLSENAEVDVKPELEIFADDVKCSHGAACGELDAEQLFYMRSRGIGEEEARQLLIDAYLDEVISKVGDEKIRAWIKLLLQE